MTKYRGGGGGGGGGLLLYVTTPKLPNERDEGVRVKAERCGEKGEKVGGGGGVELRDTFLQSAVTIW